MMAWIPKLGRRCCLEHFLNQQLGVGAHRQSHPFAPHPFVGGRPSIDQSRPYISAMHKSAFEDHILRLIRSEIRYEMEVSPQKESVSTFSSFTVEDRPGEQWLRLHRKYGDDEDIKVEVTMFDGFQRQGDKGQDVQMHISLIVDVCKGDDSNPLEFICSAWPDALIIRKVFMLKRHKMPPRPYIGPDFVELDDELQEALQEFLEVRGVNDQLASFLHQYMMNKDKTEYVRWMENLKSFIEK